MTTTPIPCHYPHATFTAAVTIQHFAYENQGSIGRSAEPVCLDCARYFRQTFS